jgi:hypothetical protein
MSRHRYARYRIIFVSAPITTDASEALQASVRASFPRGDAQPHGVQARQPHRPLTSALRWMSDVSAADGWRHVCSWTSALPQ